MITFVRFLATEGVKTVQHMHLGDGAPNRGPPR